MGSVSSVGKFLKSLEVKGGIAATAYLGDYYGQVIYILPNSSNGNAGDLILDAGKGTATAVDWNELLKCSKEVVESRNGLELVGEPAKVTLENGDKAIALAVSNVSEINAKTKTVRNLTTNDEYTKQVSINKDDIPDGEGAIIAVVPKDDNDIDSVFDSISTDIPGWVFNKLAVTLMHGRAV